MSTKPNRESLSPKGEVRLELRSSPNIRLTVPLHVPPKPVTLTSPDVYSVIWFPYTGLPPLLK